MMKHSPAARLIIVFLPFCVAACSPSDETIDCFVADTIAIHHSPALQASGFTLVTRQSGFGEKLEFLELYQGQAAFSEDCNTTEAPLLDKIFVDEEEGEITKVRIENRKLHLTQDPQGLVGTDISTDFPVEIASD